MPNDALEVVNQTISWTPELIVELIRSLAWPAAVLILGFRFRSGIFDALQSFLLKNSVTELSAGTGGITAKFQAAQQSHEIKEEGLRKSVVSELPEGADYASVVKKHEENSTEFSDQLFDLVKKHVDALGVSDVEKIDLLSKEVSILQAGLRYFDLNKVMFRSQFDLFNGWMNDGKVISESEIKSYFSKIREASPLSGQDWDYVKYMSYPISSGVVEIFDGGYRLTKFGRSYVDFMRKNPTYINDLSKL